MRFELRTPCLKHNTLSPEPLSLCSLMRVVDSFIDNSVLYNLKKEKWDLNKSQSSLPYQKGKVKSKLFLYLIFERIIPL